jgi:hypothetical protein
MPHSDRFRQNGRRCARAMFTTVTSLLAGDILVL